MENSCFYYAVHTPDGVFSLADRPVFTGNCGYIVKGHSDAVKQRLFDSVKLRLEAEDIKYIDFCKADGSCGVFSEESGFHIADGEYVSGADDVIINLSDFQDNEYINQFSEEIKDCIEKRDNAIKRCRRFLSASKSINEDVIRLDTDNIDIAKINRYTSRLWQKYGGKMSGRVGTESKRFVTCITPDGVELNMQAFDILCDNVIVVSDKTGACARIITDRIRRYALGAGYDVISCLCPMNISAVPEHIIIPELKFGVFSSKYFHRAQFENSRHIFARRFITDDAGQTKHRIDFSLKAYKKLMNEAFESLETARKYEKKLDCIYYCATDIDKLCKTTWNSIESGQ